ncbi:hypothetical protein Ciccas_007369 [Cichlidogyrus casuarinus]|uniref:Uncharacterized protein n=1 Tax=Cichlidogyrus casuarinus TaxID=1844966 RepID=A0ABD2Q485_9PLAT
MCLVPFFVKSTKQLYGQTAESLVLILSVLGKSNMSQLAILYLSLVARKTDPETCDALFQKMKQLYEIGIIIPYPSDFRCHASNIFTEIFFNHKCDSNDIDVVLNTAFLEVLLRDQIIAEVASDYIDPQVGPIILNTLSHFYDTSNNCEITSLHSGPISIDQIKKSFNKKPPPNIEAYINLLHNSEVVFLLSFNLR